MTKQFWLNLPTKDVNRSKEFFLELGFKLNEHYNHSKHSACFLLGEKNIVMMLFNEEAFQGFTNVGIPDITNTADVLFSIDAESPEEVDEMIRKAVAAGGQSNHKPQPMKGWMYGSVFTDLDGHKWNVLYMDMSKMPQ